jgi:hypothetical protein
MKTYKRVDVEPHHSWPRHWIDLSGQLQAAAALPPGKEPPVSIVYEDVWAPETV